MEFSGINLNLELNNLEGKAMLEMPQIKGAGQGQPVKSILDLMPGQTFTAQILDMQPGTVTLKMGGGQLAARSLVMPDARIGDMASFVVKENKKGQISLQFLKGAGGVSSGVVKEALAAANMPATPDNISVVKDLVANSMPIDFNNLQTAAFFKNSMPAGTPFEHVQFLMDNNFPPTEHVVKTFTKMHTGEITLTGETAQMTAILESAEFAEFTKNSPKAAEWEGIINNFKALNPPSAEGPNNYLQNLETISKEIANMSREEGQEALGQRAGNVADVIEFAKNITETKYYYQFPFSAEDREHLTHLHVFKKQGQAADKTGGKDATALIALDMAHLGRVEIYVNKNDKNVNLQFRSDKGSTLTKVTQNSLDLSELLKDKGYILTNLKTKKLDEKFDLPQNDAAAEATKKPKWWGKTAGEPPEGKRYSFDMRV